MGRFYCEGLTQSQILEVEQKISDLDENTEYIAPKDRNNYEK